MITVETDGSNLPDGSETQSVVIIKEDGFTLAVRIQRHGRGYSDVAEYSGVRQALLTLIEMRVENEKIVLLTDSLFVAKGMSGAWRIKKNKAYYPIALECLALKTNFKNLTFHWRSRSNNLMCDSLSKIKGE